MRSLIFTFSTATVLGCASCVHVHTDPIEVKPITLNINLKVDRQLDDFFSFENKYQATTQASQPSVAQ